MTQTIELAADLARSVLFIAGGLGLLSTVLLGYELYKLRKTWSSSLIVFTTGIAGIALLLAAVFRPTRVDSDATSMGARMFVLLDASRSIDLPADKSTRREVAAQVIHQLSQKGKEARYVFESFGQGPGQPIPPEAIETFRVDPESKSDLTAALEAIARASDERPAALVVVSDGRLDRPVAPIDKESISRLLPNVPIHTVGLTAHVPRDASIRKVSTAGAAVAHQPFSLRIEVGCAGGMDCEKVPVTVRELKEGESAETLAEGDVPMKDGEGTIELPITLHLAGQHVIEVEIDQQRGDEIPDNDRRYLTLDVARDRIRVLHVAGRPTYDVRALRMWLKADKSVDVVAFFILRTATDDVQATSSELALIPFPVDELFTTQLRTFDAVVLQDFNAEEYGLTRHLASLTEYVKKGGGLIMVGGPDSFGPGMYANSPLATVLPVTLTPKMEEKGVDLAHFTPVLTPAGKAAPVLGPLRALIGDELPDMPGTNIVGDARPGSTVLAVHPKLTVGHGQMPVLALGEAGNGRTIALTVDGSHKLLFSNFATQAAGRAHGALWDGLLGWLMRDPRFESTVVDLPNGCFAGEATTLVLHPLPDTKGKAHLTITELSPKSAKKSVNGHSNVVFQDDKPISESPEGTVFIAKDLPAGGFSAHVEIESQDGRGPAARRDFACEKGGDEWADSRPDLERLKSLSELTKGVYVSPDELGKIPLPTATKVSTRRSVKPLLPPWAWTLAAAVVLGMHWFARRARGLS